MFVLAAAAICGLITALAVRRPLLGSGLAAAAAGALHLSVRWVADFAAARPPILRGEQLLIAAAHSASPIATTATAFVAAAAAELLYRRSWKAGSYRVEDLRSERRMGPADRRSGLRGDRRARRAAEIRAN